MFEILEVKRLDRQGKRLKGLASVRISTNSGLIDLLNWRIVKQDNGRLYIQVPSVSWKSEEDGEIRFQQLIRMPRELQQKIELEILTRWLKENGDEDTR